MYKSVVDHSDHEFGLASHGTVNGYQTFISIGNSDNPFDAVKIMKRHDLHFSNFCKEDLNFIFQICKGANDSWEILRT